MRIEITNLTLKPWLSPPERWAASWVLKQRRRNRSAQAVRFDENYGPVGASLMAAGYLWFFVGWILGVAGVAILVFNQTRDAIGYYFLYAGMALQILVFVRCAQGVRVGRRYRGERPIAK